MISTSEPSRRTLPLAKLELRALGVDVADGLGVATEVVDAGQASAGLDDPGICTASAASKTRACGIVRMMATSSKEVWVPPLAATEKPGIGAPYMLMVL